MNKKINSAFIAAFAVIIISAVCLYADLSAYTDKFVQEEAAFEKITANADNVKDFELGSGVLTALSDDPWLVYYTDTANVYAGVDIYVNSLSEGYTSTDIFTSVNGKMSCKSVRLHEGSNYIPLDNMSGVEYIRLDLLNRTGEKIGFDRIVLNERSYVTEDYFRELRLNVSAFVNKNFVFIPLIWLGVVVYCIFRGKNGKKVVLIASGAALGAMLLHFAAVNAAEGLLYPEKTIGFEDFAKAEGNVTGFEVKDGTLTAVSNDPWVVFEDRQLDITKTVTVNVSEINSAEGTCKGEIFVFYKDKHISSIPLVFKEGANTAVMPDDGGRIKNLRFDFTSVPGEEIGVEGIVLNDSEQLAPLMNGIRGCQYTRLILWLMLMIIPFAVFSLISFKKTLRLDRAVIAVLAAGMFFASLYLGASAVILSAALCAFIARFVPCGKRKKYTMPICMVLLFAAAAAIYIFLPQAGILSLMWKISANNALRIYLALICSVFVGMCIKVMLAKDTAEQGIDCMVLTGMAFDGMFAAAAALMLDCTANIFFNGYNFIDALYTAIHSQHIYLNILLAAAIYFFIRLLLGAIPGRFAGVSFGLLFWLGNFVKLKYHDSTFKPMDMLQIGDFMGIVTRYIPAGVFYILLVLLAGLIIFAVYKKRRFVFSRRPELCFAAVSLMLIIVCYGKIQANAFEDIGVDVTQLWRGTKDCVARQGVVCSSYIEFGTVAAILPKADENYSKEYMEALRAEFDSLEHAEQTDIKPDVILVMEESMFDVERLKDVSFSEKVNTNMNKYNKTTVISPKYGGGTASVEFEALTGLSNYYFLDNIVPYVTYWNDTEKEIPSLAGEFNKNGYKTIAIHPNKGNAYNRNVVYECMRFNEFVTSEDLDFSVENVADDGYFKDDALADVIEEKLKDTQEPAFIFAITIENHTLYENKYKNTEVKVDSDKLSPEALHSLEQYSQGVLNADRFIAKMVDYVDNAQRPTIMYVWGDHLPALSAFGDLGYIEEIHDKYGTPLVAYSNYKDIDINEQYITPNQIAPQVLRDSGVKYSSYFDFVYSLREPYPVIQKEFSIPSEDELIKKYEMVQYDLLFGKKYLLGYD